MRSLIAKSILLLILSFVSPGAAQDCIQYEDFLHWANRVDIPGGSTGTVAWAGDHAYVPSRGGVWVVDFSTPGSPQVVGTVGTGGDVTAIVLRGNLACLLDAQDPGYKFVVLDISDPTDPAILGLVPLPALGTDLALSGDFALVADGMAGLVVVGVSDPGDPEIVNSLPLPGQTAGVTTAGDHAFVAGWSGCGLRVIDISTPAEPVEVGSALTSVDFYDVAARGDHLFLGLADSLIVVDVSSPASPQSVASAYIPGDVPAITLAQDLAFVITRPYPIPADLSGPGAPGLNVVDISSPAAPLVLGHLSIMGAGAALAGDRILVSGGDSGLEIVDMPDPAAAPLIGSYGSIWETGEPYSTACVATAGGRVYLVSNRDSPSPGPSRFTILDLSDPGAPVVLGMVTSGPAEDLQVQGSHAYLAMLEFGLVVLDVSDPGFPVPVGNASFGFVQATSVAVAGDLAVVGLSHDGLGVVDISDPASPAVLGTLDPGGEVCDLALAGDHVFVANPYRGLQVIDITDPSAPVLLATETTPDGARGIAIRDGHVFLGDGDGLVVIQIADPVDPAFVAEVPAPGPASDVLIAGDFLYLSVNDLQVYDVGDPTSPRVVGTVPSGEAWQAAVQGDRVLVAAGFQGLQIAPGPCAQVTTVPGGSGAPSRATRLHLPHPNPFNPRVAVRFDLARPQVVRIAVYDLAGHRVAILADQFLGAGNHGVDWNGLDASGRPASSGTYLVRMETEERMEARKVVLTR